MVGAIPDLRTLSQQDWESLFQETLLFAHYQVQRLRWRGLHGGIMPDGYDPNSLASQAFLDLLQSGPNGSPSPWPERCSSDTEYQECRVAAVAVPLDFSRAAPRPPNGDCLQNLPNGSLPPEPAIQMGTGDGAPSPRGEGWGEGDRDIRQPLRPPGNESTGSGAQCANSFREFSPGGEGEPYLKLNRSGLGECQSGAGRGHECRLAVYGPGCGEGKLDLLLPANPLLPLPQHLQGILYHLNRLVLRHVTRLHHRKENHILSHVEDLAPIQIDDDGSLINPIELIQDDFARHPDAALLEKESLARFDALKSRFSSFIERERRLAHLFQLLCDCTEKPQALALRLKIRPAAVTNLRKQLRRRWRACFASAQSILPPSASARSKP
jgi:hypothetical protein